MPLTVVVVGLLGRLFVYLSAYTTELEDVVRGLEDRLDRWKVPMPLDTSHTAIPIHARMLVRRPRRCVD